MNTGQSNSVNWADIAKDFPLLDRIGPNNRNLIYLDSAATALKPQCVIDAVHEMLTSHTANIHRSVHLLGDEATEAYESTRDIVAAFINAEPNEIVFLRNTTEALNLIAQSHHAKKAVLTTLAEHHSNLLPWIGNTIRLNINKDGEIDLAELEFNLKNQDIGLVSVGHISNVTGVSLNIKEIARLCHQYGAKLLVDAAQSAPHHEIDVADIDCDFLAFSGHKLGSPTGVGVLYGKAELLEEMDIRLHGGSTVEEVHADRVIPKNAPWKFEAGTPAIESVVGLGAAIGYLMEIGMPEIEARFRELSDFTYKKISSTLPEEWLIGNKASHTGGPYSLRIDGISPHVVARGLSDRYGICVRSGFHCAQPLHEALQSPASLRLSYWIYNSEDEIDQAVEGIKELTRIVG